MDELGGVELSIKEYLHIITLILESGVPCIGVLKSYENLERLNQSIPQNQDAMECYKELRMRITTQYGGRIITLREQNKNEVKKLVQDFFTNITI